MGALFDTQAFYVHNPSTSETAYTAASGDSLVNRFFQAPATASLVTFDRQGVTKGVYRLRSPLMYDNVKGIHIAASGGQTIFELPAVGVQPFYSQDTLILEGTGETGAYDLVTMTRYYSNFQGSDMRLASWGTIMPMIVNLYEIEIATTSTSTPTAWTDTVVTTTENLLKANTDYAVLGYTVSLPCVGVYINGIDTGNLNVAVPGYWNTKDGADFFVRKSLQYGTPHIPVINSNNAPNISVACASVTTSATSVTTFRLAQLSQLLPNPVGG